LLEFTGQGIYNTITKATQNGRITAKMLILLSRYLDVDPFFLLGETEEKGNYNEDLLKKLLIKLGYRSLWNEYAKHLKTDTTLSDETNPREDPVEPAEKAPATPIITDGQKHDAEQKQADLDIKEPAGEYNGDNTMTEVTKNIVDVADDISPETINIMNNLTEEKMIILLRALLIRSEIQNSSIKQVVDKIKLLLLLN
jgi:hypothetical protein